MTNYTKSTNFATKDALASGNALKIVKGTEIDTEFNNIATAVATKADLVSPTFTGTPTLPTGTIATTQSLGNNTTAIATTAFIQAALSALYPVGAIYINATSSTNPATSLGFGTWTAFGAGRVMVGFDSGNVLFDTAEETGGSADAIVPTHTHTATSTDSGHTHTYAGAVDSSGTFPYAAGGGNAGIGTPRNAGSTTNSSTASITTTVATAGVSPTNTNYQPYITVYIWKRTV